MFNEKPDISALRPETVAFRIMRDFHVVGIHHPILNRSDSLFKPRSVTEWVKREK
jgi:hypothetical protein